MRTAIRYMNQTALPPKNEMVRETHPTFACALKLNLISTYSAFHLNRFHQIACVVPHIEIFHFRQGK